MSLPVPTPVTAPHGPIYCDTAHMWLGIHEPANTITNAAILIAAWFAFRYIKRERVGFSFDLVLLLILLVGVGIGSTLWHGLRTFWALQLDWIPGVLFLLVLSVVWIRQMFKSAALGWLAGIAGMLAMMALSIVGVFLFGRSLVAISPNLIALPMFATVTVFGLLMLAGTAAKYGRDDAMLGVAIIGAALVAAVARSIDLMMCAYIPFGTHFLWHIGLSTASCLGIVLMVRMKKARARHVVAGL